jgi:hypothetical protein
MALLRRALAWAPLCGAVFVACSDTGHGSLPRSGGGAGTDSAGGAAGAGGATTSGGSSAGGVTTSGGSSGGPATGGAASGGSSAGTSAGGGAGGSNLPALVLPIERDGKYVLEFGSTLFEVDPEAGGRITRFELAGQNVIAGEDVTHNELAWGSTFWPSPQTEWVPGGTTNDWPPIATIDSEPYTAGLEGTTIVLTSPPPADNGQARLSVVKRFSADLAAQAVVIEFVLKNEAAEARSWAPWQITRVGPNGLTFFATGTAPVYKRLNTTESGGVTWFAHPDGLPQNPPGDPKLAADAAEPWIAHVAGGLMLVKRFANLDPSQFAPGEGEVEIYAVNDYVELEPQGAYSLLQPGATLSWTVRWYLRELPAATVVTPGNAELIALARSLAP